MPLTRRHGIALLLAVTLLAPLRAEATTTCSATMTGISFGNVDPTNSLVNATATLNYSCTYTAGLLGILYGVYARLCFSIGSGAQGTGGINPRQMTSVSGDAMLFQLHSDSGRSQIWGSVDTPGFTPLQRDVQFSILGVGTTQSGSATVYGQVPAAQTTLGVGSYSNAFSGIHTKLSYQYNEALLSLGSYPATCGTANNGSFPFTATAAVQPVCTVSAANLSFGIVAGFLTSNRDATSAISLRCTYRAAWQIGLDNGQHASASVRRMSGPGGLITYGLFRDTPGGLRWGSTLNTDTLTGTGTGSTQNLTVYGRVSPQTTPAAGTYTDTIVVTVTY
jgi:spore coat protein U-like protein